MAIAKRLRAGRLASFALVVVGACLGLPHSSAAGRPYVAIDAGTITSGTADIRAGDEHLQADFKSLEGTFDGAAGYDFGPIRLEGRIGFTRMETDNLSGGSINNNGSVQLWNGTVNAYWDISLTDALTFYAGGGVGATYADMHDFATTNGNDVGFVWNVQTGITYAITKHVDFGVAHRFLAVRNIGDEGEEPGEPSTEADIDAHIFLATLQYSF
jgi:opacity protein-like surface antigen